MKTFPLNQQHIHNDAIGRPDRPQCSSFKVNKDEPNIAFPKFIAFESDKGVHLVANVCNAWLRFIILIHDCHPLAVMLRFSDISTSFAAS